MNRRPSHKKRWLVIGGIVVLLVIFVVFVDVGVVVDSLRQANWGVWGVGIVFLLVGYVINTLRWRYVLGVKPGRLPLFYSDSLAYMGNMITPIPAAVSRLFTTEWVTSASGSQTTSGMVIDRLLETMMRLITTIFLVTLLATGYAEATSAILTNLGIVALGVSGLVWVTKHQALVIDKLAHWLSHLPRLNEEQIRNTMGALLQNLAYAGSTSHLLKGLAISIAMWTFFLVFQYLALLALQPAGAPIDRQTLIAAVGVLILIPPSTTAMIGLYHSVVIGALVGFQLLDITTATAYAIVLHLPQMAFWFLAGGLAINQTNIDLKKLLEAAKTYQHRRQKPPIADNT